MSGGHFNFEQFKLHQLADDIEQMILDNDAQDWEDKYAKETIAEFKEAVRLLRRAYIYVQRVDWLVSGDDTPATFHKRLHAQLKELE
jgi:hypothetical protein